MTVLISTAPEPGFPLKHRPDLYIWNVHDNPLGTMSKPILYTYSQSVWAAVPELAILELGYAPGAIEKKVVDLGQGENFAPAFLKVNPNGTLPTIAVGDETHVSTAEVTSYLLKHAPKPAKPGTSLIAKIHEDKYDPNFALLLARSNEELQQKPSFVTDFVKNRQDALERYAPHPDGAQHKTFYDSKLTGNGFVLSVYQGTAPDEHKQAFLQQSSTHWDNLKQFISDELPGLLPDTTFCGGDHPGEDDFHLAAWLARLALVAGRGSEQDGVRALEKGFGIKLHPKVSAYLVAWNSRKRSWQEVYAEGLH